MRRFPCQRRGMQGAFDHDFLPNPCPESLQRTGGIRIGIFTQKNLQDLQFLTNPSTLFALREHGIKNGHGKRFGWIFEDRSRFLMTQFHIFQQHFQKRWLRGGTNFREGLRQEREEKRMSFACHDPVATRGQDQSIPTQAGRGIENACFRGFATESTNQILPAMPDAREAKTQSPTGKVIDESGRGFVGGFQTMPSSCKLQNAKSGPGLPEDFRQFA